jgi:DNA helicase II / ATP-dependent DNA helicase PcrA
MAIDSREFDFEKSMLSDIRNWLDREVDTIGKNNEELKRRVMELKKQSKGSYNEELETALKLLEITEKNVENYTKAHEQPYFARIDFREYRREQEKFYIGKFGLGDSKTGEEVVIDWRAPIADLYYSGTQGEAYYRAPMGIINGELSLKRKFLFRDGRLADAYDEGINEIILKSGLGEENALIDEFLRINLEQSISSKLKEVVATIQKEQNEIIRADKNQAVIVQGSAGSGKTTVALHRLAYLLYRYQHKLSGDEILVIAPNKLFLDYISEVLPNLGVDKVKQKTFEELSLEILNMKGKLLSRDKKLASVLEMENNEDIKYITNCSKVKGTLIFKTMMDRYIQLIEREDSNVEDIKVDNYILFESKEVKRLYSKDLVNLPINRRKDEIKRYLTLKLNEKIMNILEKIDFSYEYQISRAKKTMEEGPERRRKLIELYDERDAKKAEIKSKSLKDFEDYFSRWKNNDTKDLYYKLFKNTELLHEVSGDRIPEALLKYLVKDIEKNEIEGITDSDDLAAMLYLKFRVEGVPDKYKAQHIVLDEAQDYSLFQLYIIKELTSSKSVTMVGDIGQGIYYYKGINDWHKVINEVFEKEGAFINLTQSYRSTVEIIEFANKVLKHQANNIKPAVPVLRHGKKPLVTEFKSGKDFAQALDEIVKKVLASGKKSVAVIGKTQKECKAIRDILRKYSANSWTTVMDTSKTIELDKIIIPSYMTKGLEFDCSVVYNCSSEVYGENELDKKLLYVVLTRALHFEYVFYKGQPSELIELNN